MVKSWSGLKIETKRKGTAIVVVFLVLPIIFRLWKNMVVCP